MLAASGDNVTMTLSCQWIHVPADPTALATGTQAVTLTASDSQADSIACSDLATAAAQAGATSRCCSGCCCLFRLVKLALAGLQLAVSLNHFT